jgi:hypothetical protein
MSCWGIFYKPIGLFRRDHIPTPLERPPRIPQCFGCRMLGVINRDHIRQFPARWLQDLIALGQSHRCPAIEVHRLVVAEVMHNRGFFLERHWRQKRHQHQRSALFGIADRHSQRLTFEHTAIAEAFGPRLDRDLALAHQPWPRRNREPMLLPVGFAIDAGRGHFGSIADAQAEGGAVVFPGTELQQAAAGDDVAHDPLLLIHAEEGAVDCDGGIVAFDHAAEVLIAFGLFAAVGLLGVVGETDVEENLRVGQINHRDVEALARDLTVAQGDGPGARKPGGEGDRAVGGDLSGFGAVGVERGRQVLEIGDGLIRALGQLGGEPKTAADHARATNQGNDPFRKVMW